jgi:hypothetical protein
MSVAFYPQIDRQSERTIHTLEDMLRIYVLPWNGNWEDHLAFAQFAYNNSCHASIMMAPYESLYGWKCISPLCWEVPSERLLVGPDWIQQTHYKVHQIRQNMLTAQSRQKSYADVRWRDLEFAEGDEVLLKVSSTKGIVHFGIKGKLSPRYIGLYLITTQVGSLAFQLQLPESMAGVHPVFHVSTLRKYKRDLELKMEVNLIIIQQDLTIDTQPVHVLEFSKRVMHNRTIEYVKILWSNQMEREATWKLESTMRNKYLIFFRPVSSLW